MVILLPAVVAESHCTLHDNAPHMWHHQNMTNSCSMLPAPHRRFADSRMRSTVRPLIGYIYVGAGYVADLGWYTTQANAIARPAGATLVWSFAFFRDGCDRVNKALCADADPVRAPNGNFQFWSGSWAQRTDKMKDFITYVKTKNDKVRACRGEVSLPIP